MKKELPKVYEPREVEGRVYEMWEKNGCFEGHRDPDKRPFTIVMPPPNVTGQLHMGHALDCTLQDILTRFKRMQGYAALWLPGTDHAGIATQIKVEEELRVKEGKTRYDLGREKFLERVWKWKEEYGNRIVQQQKKMGVSCDWSRARFTMDEGCSKAVRETFCELYDKGLIYKGMKPVYWCPFDQTALAEAEIEYADDPCTTIFVKFPVADDKGKLGQYADLSRTYFVIWTTTIWTLPGNLAIALHPDESYAVVKAPNGEAYIMAEALVEKVMHLGGFDTWEVAETHPGAFFENMLADHPFLPKTSRLLLADYVTMESGTGCVHTAPGFGADDYETCKRYGVEMVVPVDDQGRHTEYAGKYAGMKTDESNPVILADMKESGMLFASEDIIHSYPHCWRCKGPIIFRATPQWFCSVDAFKDEACAACDEVRWVPGWGVDRMKSMIRERADWCISRQRRWGLPIPVVYCKDCGKPVCTDETIAAISDLFGKEGSNAWFDKDPADFLPAGMTCPHCGGKSGFEKETDTLDGWFDSGSTHMASMKRDQGFWPADMYLEGLDQYRGWFQSSLLTAVGAFGNGAPFKECVTHGWTVDGEGKAMHKSLGNGVDPADIFNKYGADILRLWAASADYHADVRCSDAIFKQLSQNYLKFRNTARYCLGNLEGFDPNNLVAPADMLELDRWAVTRLNALIEKCAKAYDDYEFLVITHAVNDFCVVEMSNFYLDIIKDRLYCEEKDGLARRSAQTALYLILDTITKIMAPILCFTGDEIWLAMPHKAGDDGRNVLFNDMNSVFADYALSADEMAKWEKIIEVRTAVNGALETARAEKKIGKSLEADVALTVPAEDAFLAEMDSAGLADLLVGSQVEVTVGGELAVSVSEAAGTKCPRCWKHSTKADENGLCPRCAAVAAKLPAF